MSKKTEKTGTKRYLVFASLSSGEHTNCIVNSIDEVEAYIEASFNFKEDSVNQDDIDSFMLEVDAIGTIGGGCHHEFNNTTWFTITRIEDASVVEPVHIVFGEIPNSYKVFEFNTNEERTAFLEGIDAMDGYLAYTPAEQADEETLEILKSENESDYNALVEYLGKEVA